MMVNEMSKNSAPWPSTIPNQMPWLDPSACSPEAPMQFLGQQPYEPARILPVPSSSVAHLENPPPVIMTNNPFYPQQASGMQPLQCATTTALNVTNPQAALTSNFASSLIHMPSEQVLQANNHKRSSIEMEDDLTAQEAPPTKQQLSENKLFQRFGSLHLDSESDLPESTHPLDCDEEEECEPITSANQSSDRKQFDRYVYLLFKDKESDGQLPIGASNAIERLLREEREKLSKAVILWNPPPRGFVEEVDNDSDEELDYKDHRDFLKTTVEISEVEEDTNINEDSNCADADDIMIE